jgi:hypothetical protein
MPSEMQPWGVLPSLGSPAAFSVSLPGLRPVALRPTLSSGLPFRASFIRRLALLNSSQKTSEADLTGVTPINADYLL